MCAERATTMHTIRDCGEWACGVWASSSVCVRASQTPRRQVEEIHDIHGTCTGHERLARRAHDIDGRHDGEYRSSRLAHRDRGGLLQMCQLQRGSISGHSDRLRLADRGPVHGARHDDESPEEEEATDASAAA